MEQKKTYKILDEETKADKDVGSVMRVGSKRLTSIIKKKVSVVPIVLKYT